MVGSINTGVMRRKQLEAEGVPYGPARSEIGCIEHRIRGVFPFPLEASQGWREPLGDASLTGPCALRLRVGSRYNIGSVTEGCAPTEALLFPAFGPSATGQAHHAQSIFPEMVTNKSPC